MKFVLDRLMFVYTSGSIPAGVCLCVSLCESVFGIQKSRVCGRPRRFTSPPHSELRFADEKSERGDDKFGNVATEAEPGTTATHGVVINTDVVSTEDRTSFRSQIWNVKLTQEECSGGDWNLQAGLSAGMNTTLFNPSKRLSYTWAGLDAFYGRYSVQKDDTHSPILTLDMTSYIYQ
ncbi:hypothetical protein PROFUN_03487 [Planoprotostelium fungivorum]|uniref:Uncharacterized protein n=1 Tax=Planoprotostelium fungivorum TaxID=1890364 RepID=A0A2P6MN93_9EUKA|nr:hypothetical protein PROFUN_03487 [Planoprotostelium fungivorum]